MLKLKKIYLEMLFSFDKRGEHIALGRFEKLSIALLNFPHLYTNTRKRKSVKFTGIPFRLLNFFRKLILCIENQFTRETMTT